MCERSMSGLKKTHYLDVVGPILPDTLKQMRILLARTQHDFTVQAVELDCTSAFKKVAL